MYVQVHGCNNGRGFCSDKIGFEKLKEQTHCKERVRCCAVCNQAGWGGGGGGGGTERETRKKEDTSGTYLGCHSKRQTHPTFHFTA